jgi:hypothetical protein
MTLVSSRKVGCWFKNSLTLSSRFPRGLYFGMTFSTSLAAKSETGHLRTTAQFGGYYAEDRREWARCRYGRYPGRKERRRETTLCPVGRFLTFYFGCSGLGGVSRSHARDPCRNSEILGLAPVASLILFQLLFAPACATHALAVPFFLCVCVKATAVAR